MEDHSTRPEKSKTLWSKIIKNWTQLGTKETKRNSPAKTLEAALVSIALRLYNHIPQIWKLTHLPYKSKVVDTRIQNHKFHLPRKGQSLKILLHKLIFLKPILWLKKHANSLLNLRRNKMLITIIKISLEHQIAV